jgi:hypothetical protein
VSVVRPPVLLAYAIPRYNAFFRPGALVPVMSSMASNIAPAMGTIMIAHAVLDSTIESAAVTPMKAARTMTGRVPTTVREYSAMRRCRPLFSTARATMKEPMNTHMVSLKYLHRVLQKYREGRA